MPFPNDEVTPPVTKTYLEFGIKSYFFPIHEQKYKTTMTNSSDYSSDSSMVSYPLC